MSQTKRKRRTKHRGNAAGVVERRGRTSRPDPAAEKERRKQEARQRRASRFDRPPSWRTAFARAGVASAMFFFIILFLFKDGIGAAVGLALFMLVIYTPMSYYTDLFTYRRRQRRKTRP